MQLCFETEEKARKLLHNVSSLLKPGGYFLGITPDSSTIWYGSCQRPIILGFSCIVSYFSLFLVLAILFIWLIGDGTSFDL